MIERTSGEHLGKGGTHGGEAGLKMRSPFSAKPSRASASYVLQLERESGLMVD